MVNPRDELAALLDDRGPPNDWGHRRVDRDLAEWFLQEHGPAVLALIDAAGFIPMSLKYVTAERIQAAPDAGTAIIDCQVVDVKRLLAALSRLTGGHDE